MTGSSGNKKILCASVMQSWGGGEEFLLNLNSFVSGYEFIIASPPGNAAQKFRDNGIQVEIINGLKKIFKNNGGWDLLSVLKVITGGAASTIKIIKLTLKSKSEIILANGSYAGIYSLPAALIAGRKLIIVQHLIYPASSLESRALKILNRYSFKIVCISNSVASNVHEILGSSSKTAVIRHGIKVQELSKETKIKSGTIDLGIVGSIIRLKGIDLVIESIKELLLTNPNIFLHIFGSVRKDEDDSLKYEKEIKGKIDTYGISDQVIFHGFVESKEDIYRALDIVINYSIVPESFSLTVLEAAARGRIVIASDLGGPKEIIKDGDSGFLVEAASPEKLREKIKFCVENLYSEGFDKIRENAAVSVRKNFSFERFADEYKELFNSVQQQ